MKDVVVLADELIEFANLGEVLTKNATSTVVGCMDCDSGLPGPHPAFSRRIAASQVRNAAKPPVISLAPAGICKRGALMKPAIYVLLSSLVLGVLSAPAAAEEFHGWQAMRVIHQRGFAYRMYDADIDGDGRAELLCVNTRQARIDIYEWMPEGDREVKQVSKDRGPNTLPMAMEFHHEELSLDALPLDLAAGDFTGDGKVDLAILVGPPYKIQLFENMDGDWSRTRMWDLLEGDLAGRGPLLLPLKNKDGSTKMLVTFSQGMTELTLKDGERAKWVMPRQKVTRMNWWLADADGDGDDDLIEWLREAKQTVRWYENSGDQLLPARVIYDEPADMVETLVSPDGRAEVMLLGGLQQGLLRRYRMVDGEESPIGNQQALPMETGSSWTGITIDGKPHIAVVDPKQPRATVYELKDSGWAIKESYPIISQVQDVAAPPAVPGTLLMWTKDGADLYHSKWENGRLSYPKPISIVSDGVERKILAFGQASNTTWWIQRIGSDLHLWTWAVGSEQPVSTQFKGLGKLDGKETDSAQWLGGNRILFKQKFSKEAKLATLDTSGEVTISEVAHLQSAPFEQFQLFGDGEKMKLARIHEGVLQWLGEDLFPADQIMLDQGAELADYLPIGDDGSAWAMQAGNGVLHKLELDNAGLPKVKDSYRVHFGGALIGDPVLGVLLADGTQVIRLSNGKPKTLELIDSLDGRGESGGDGRHPAIHRMMTVDVTGDGHQDVLLADDAEHQLTLLKHGEEKLQPLMDWQVYEDEKYPYGDGGGFQAGQTESEPRSVAAGDFDGDGKQDLALLSQDRLLIYLGTKP